MLNVINAENYLEQRHITLASGRSSIGLEREYWKALETLAYEDGWHNWRDFFYRNILPNKPDDMPYLVMCGSLLPLSYFRYTIRLGFLRSL